MLYTSGTTGRPKGVVRRDLDCRITDPRATTMFGPMFERYQFTPQTVYLSTAPLYHAGPLRYAITTQFLGGTVVMMEKFDELQSLALIERYRVTHSQWVPTMFIRLLKLPLEDRGAFDLSSHRVAIHAAAPCPAEVKQQMIAWWGPIVEEYFGASEGNGVTVIDSREWLAHPGSVGRPLAGILHICDDDGRELPPGEPGLIYFVVERDFADRFVATAMTAYGGIDIIVNNAGYTWDNVIQKMTDEQWYAMIDVHLTAPFRLLRAAQPVIRNLAQAEDQAGTPTMRKVVNISSVAGVFGNAGQVNYSTGKAGVIGMTQTLAKEWGRLRTTVNCVAFGLINTRLTGSAADGGTASIAGRDIKVGVNPDLLAAMERTIPLGRAGTPEDAAGAVYLFTLPESDYVSGQTLLCTGGLTGI
jgi:3-oxoacyl-[acyl-carrier protein] reductase